MLYLECKIRTPAGLRETDVIAVVTDCSGDKEQIQIEKNFLVKRAERYFLCPASDESGRTLRLG